MLLNCHGKADADAFSGKCESSSATTKRAMLPPAPHKGVWWLLEDEVKLKEDERAFVEELMKDNPLIKDTRELTQEFQCLIRSRDEKHLDDWFEAVAQNDVAEFKSFAKGLRSDEAAVRAAMTYEWSNGMVEGHVYRLKLIKRQMYGRAKFDLLNTLLPFVPRMIPELSCVQCEFPDMLLNVFTYLVLPNNR